MEGSNDPSFFHSSFRRAEQVDDLAEALLTVEVTTDRSQTEVLLANTVDEGPLQRVAAANASNRQHHDGSLQHVGAHAPRVRHPAARMDVDIAVALVAQTQDPRRVVRQGQHAIAAL